MHFTDPRFWGWLYAIEKQVRAKVPLTYLHIWDDLPYPMWNRPFYQSCDALFAISKQSNNIAKHVLGAEKVDRFFLQDASESDYGTMSAAVDPIRKLVIWNYKTVNGNRSVIIYNFKTQKWTYGDAGTDFLAEASTSAVTLESLDSISGSIDALTTSLDSQLYVGGKYFLGGTLATRVMFLPTVSPWNTNTRNTNTGRHSKSIQFTLTYTNVIASPLNIENIIHLSISPSESHILRLHRRIERTET